jgi:hypothetical protein
MSMFSEGNVVLLQSLASERGLCVKYGRVSGTGIKDLHSQFTVHVRQYGRIALQNVADRSKWLQIRDGETRAQEDGMGYSDFNLHEIGDSYVALESAIYPGQHVGIREDGELQPPDETPPMDRGSLFIPFLHSPPASARFSSFVTHSDRRRQENWEAVRTPDRREYFVNHTTQATSWTRPSPHPASPTGYSILDLFRGNALLIVPVVETTYDYDVPLTVEKSGMQTMFGYPRWVTDPSNSGLNFFNCVVHGSVVADDRVILRTTAGTVWVNNAKKIFVMKKAMERGKHEQFIVHQIRDSIVVFESALFPNRFVTFEAPNRIAVLEYAPSPSYYKSYRLFHFTIRVKQFNSNFSSTALSPFGNENPAIVSPLFDKAVIQLYHQPSQLFLGVHGSQVVLIDNEEDKRTFWEYRDRGMGRASLCLHRTNTTLSMNSSGDLSTVGGMGNIANADFHVLEYSTGEIALKSCGKTEKHVSLWSAKYRVLIEKFSIYLLDVLGDSKLIPRDALN